VSTYRGKDLVIRRDGTVVYGGDEIGRVYPDPPDNRVQSRTWRYEHVTGTTLKDLHPHWRWPRTGQTALTKRLAAEGLADLHRATGSETAQGVSREGTRRYSWKVLGESRQQHSNPEWRPAEASGVIEVPEELADAGDALVTIITGKGEGATLKSTIPWDLFTLDREVTIVFGPERAAESPGG
jgi:hypothetical protein